MRRWCGVGGPQKAPSAFATASRCWVLFCLATIALQFPPDLSVKLTRPGTASPGSAQRSTHTHTNTNTLVYTRTRARTRIHTHTHTHFCFTLEPPSHMR